VGKSIQGDELKCLGSFNQYGLYHNENSSQYGNESEASVEL